MMDLTPHLPILQVLVPMFAALLIAFVRQGWLAWSIALAASWLTFAIAIY